MYEHLWRWPEAKECPPGCSGTIFRCRSQQASACVLVLGACSCSPPRVALGWAWVPPALAAGPPLTLHRLLCPLCACAAPSCHCERLSLQDLVSWSTTDRPGMSIASYAAAASSPSGHGPSSRTRRIITVFPVTRASSLLAALVAKRYVWPGSPKPPRSLTRGHVPAPS